MYLESHSRYGVFKVGVDEAAVPRPLDGADGRFRVDGTLQLGSLVLLHPQGVLGTHDDPREVCGKKFAINRHYSNDFCNRL